MYCCLATCNADQTALYVAVRDALVLSFASYGMQQYKTRCLCWADTERFKASADCAEARVYSDTADKQGACD